MLTKPIGDETWKARVQEGDKPEMLMLVCKLHVPSYSEKVLTLNTLFCVELGRIIIGDHTKQWLAFCHVQLVPFFGINFSALSFCLVSTSYI